MRQALEVSFDQLHAERARSLARQVDGLSASQAAHLSDSVEVVLLEIDSKCQSLFNDLHIFAVSLVLSNVLSVLSVQPIRAYCHPEASSAGSSASQLAVGGPIEM